jgi:hypothetical protein
VKDLIMNPEETGKITEVIGEGEYYGMRTFDQSLLSYVMEGKVAEQGDVRAGVRRADGALGAVVPLGPLLDVDRGHHGDTCERHARHRREERRRQRHPALACDQAAQPATDA